MEKLATPTDELSGLPLLMVPDDRVLPILWGYEKARDPNGQLLTDWNHAHHPGKEVVQAGEGGSALRNARIQYVLRQEQHDEYHGYFDGPPLPGKPSERFKSVVLCAAGYIPLRGLAFGPDGPYTPDLSEWQIIRLRESGEVKVASFSVVQRFMKEFVLKQSVDHIKPKTINKFLRINPRESVDARKEHAFMAHRLLSLVIDRVEDPLMEPYRRAYKSGLLMPGVPERPDYFIHDNIIRSRRNMQGIIGDFTRKLVLHRDGPQALRRLGRTAIVT